jgi:membrane protease YdiL (CAAX protease family)
LSYQGAVELPLAILLVTVVAVSEETDLRRYLTLRFTTTTGSTVAAVLLSSQVFGLGHVYEGTAGFMAVGALGLALAWVYVRTRSLVALIVFHFAQEFLGMVACHC